MRPIVYILLAAVAFLIFKAFFLDDYLAKKDAAEANATVESNQSDLISAPEPAMIEPVKTEVNETAKSDKKVPPPSYSEMPLEKVGGTIAETIEGKI